MLTATEIQASSYEAQGYKLAEGSTKIKVAAGTTAYTLKWVKAAAAASASVTAPQTAALYNSTINNANAIGLTATLTDAGNIITNITWTSSNEKVVKVSKWSENRMYTDSSWKRKCNCYRYDHILIKTGRYQDNRK